MIRRALRPAPVKPGANLLDSAGEKVSTWYGLPRTPRGDRVVSDLERPRYSFTLESLAALEVS